MSEKEIKEHIENLPEEQREIFEKEGHDIHPLEIVNGQLRWKQTVTDSDYDNKDINLNGIAPLFYALGWDKNSPEYRHLYRSIGYSIYGYWEIFYWEMNNVLASEFKGLESPLQSQDELKECERCGIVPAKQGGCINYSDCPNKPVESQDEEKECSCPEKMQPGYDRPIIMSDGRRITGGNESQDKGEEEKIKSWNNYGIGLWHLLVLFWWSFFKKYKATFFIWRLDQGMIAFIAFKDAKKLNREQYNRNFSHLIPEEFKKLKVQ